LHYIGSLLVLAILAYALITQQWLWLLAMPLPDTGLPGSGISFREEPSGDVSVPAVQLSRRLGDAQGHAHRQDSILIQLGSGGPYRAQRLPVTEWTGGLAQWWRLGYDRRASAEPMRCRLQRRMPERRNFFQG
jgi:hypothetical protein